MLERFQTWFRVAALLLALLAVLQVARLVKRGQALSQIRVPAGSFQVAQNSTAAASGTNANATANANANADASHSGGPHRPAPNLPPEIGARIEKIKEAQILGMIMRPPPMALMGIAGRDVFLRAANGQTGLVREGEELGGVKLLRVGTNRVLVEHEGQKRELTLFEGIGSDSLLGKETSP